MATSRSRSKRPASKTSRTKRANQNPARQRGAARPATGAAGSVKRSKSSWPKAGKRPAPRALPPARVAAAVATMSAPSGTARFGAGKVLCVTAAKDPVRVYPHFDAFAALLNSDSKVVRWNALQIIAALTPADSARKIDALLDTYLAFIAGGNLISAANAIGGAGRIAACRPDLLDRIIPALLATERATYETDECRNVALGHVLRVVADLGPAVCNRPDVAAFIRRQQANPRAPVARHAKRLAAGLSPGA